MNRILIAFLVILSGICNGQSIITIRQVYNFNVGDVFEYKIKAGGFFSGEMGYRKTILQKRESKNLDTITYSIKIETYDWNSTFSSRVVDTSYTMLDSNISKPIRQEYITNLRMLYFKDSVYFHDTWGENVYDYMTSDGHLGVQGLRAQNLDLLEEYFSDAFSVFLTKLSYYKKGNLEFGTKDTKYELTSPRLSIPEKLSFYPNPVISKINFSNPLEANTRISIIDFTGRTIMNITNLENITEIDVCQISQGLYFLVIENAEKQYIMKFNKE